MISRILLTVLGAVLFAAVLWFWFHLALKKVEKDKRRPLYEYAVPFFITAIPGILIVSWLEKVIDPLITNNFEGVTMLIIEMFVVAALVEEGMKLLGAIPGLKIFKPDTPMDYVLMIGASGLGFAFSETCIDLWNSSTSLLMELYAVLLRGIYPFHLHTQFIMGIFLAYALINKAKGKKGARTWCYIGMIVVPLVIHALHDFVAFVDDFIPGASGFSMIFLVIEAVVVPICVYKAIKKLSKKSFADNEL